MLGKEFSPDVRDKSIATSRTMLQKYLYFEATNYENPVVWILDDDSRLSTLCWDKEKGRYYTQWDFFEILPGLRKKDIDVALCTVTGAPPLPFISCTRTQMVDLYHNLERLLMTKPDIKLDNLEIENIEKRDHYRDYYYDLSRSETDHLEQPFWYNQSFSTDGKTLFVYMVNSLDKILRGEQVFRPLIVDPKIHPFSTIIPSVNRGGNTIVFAILNHRVAFSDSLVI